MNDSTSPSRPVAVASDPWKQYPIPKNRAVWVRANIIAWGSADVEAYEGYAKYSDRGADWFDIDLEGGRSRKHASEFYVIKWMELAERAVGCPTSEQAVMARVCCGDDEFRLSPGKVGFFTIVDVSHAPTGVRLVKLTNGPFASQAEALAALSGMLRGLGRLGDPSEIHP